MITCNHWNQEEVCQSFEQCSIEGYCAPKTCNSDKECGIDSCISGFCQQIKLVAITLPLTFSGTSGTVTAGTPLQWYYDVSKIDFYYSPRNSYSQLNS